jgi:hypothetical protein
MEIFCNGEPKESVECARLIVPLGVVGRTEGVSRGCFARIVDDLSMAALTVESMPVSLGLRFEGI